MQDEISYDARVYRTEVYKGTEVTTYWVRWRVGGKLWREGFRTAAQADSFRSALLTAARKGEAFSLAAGRPRAWERRPDDATTRRALLRYGFNAKQRADPPEDVAEALAWIGRNSFPVAALAEAAVARRMLEQATGRLDGKNAAASTARRHRTILANAMDYAIELGLLEANPIRALKWSAPKVSSQVDRRSVVNPSQARALLEALRAQYPSGPCSSPSSR